MPPPEPDDGQPLVEEAVRRSGRRLRSSGPLGPRGRPAGDARLARARRGLPAAHRARADGARWRSDHPASAQRPTRPTGAVGRPAGRRSPPDAGRRSARTGRGRARPSFGARAAPGDRSRRRGAGAAVRGGRRAVRGAHPAHVGAAVALRRGELPRRPAGRRRRRSLAHRVARGAGGDRPRSDLGRADRRARPPRHGDQPLVHRPLRRCPRRAGRRPRPTRRRCRPSSTSPSPSCSTRPSSGRRRWTFPWAEDRPIFFFELVGDTVWGATGAMLRQLLGLVTGTVSRGQLDHACLSTWRHLCGRAGWRP